MRSVRKPTFFVLGIVYLLVLVFLFLFGFFYYQSNLTHYRENASRELAGVADLKVSSILFWKNQRLQDALTLQNQSDLSQMIVSLTKNPSNSLVQNEILERISILQTVNQYEIFFIDTKGKMIYSFPKNVIPLCETVISEIPKTLQTKSIAWIDLHRSHIDDKPSLSILIPMFSNPGSKEVIGFISLRIDPTIYLYPMLQKWPNDSQSAETLLVRKDGSDVLFLNELRFKNDSALKFRIPLKIIKTPAVQAVLGRIGYFEGQDYRNESVVSELRPIPNSPWYMVARIDKSEIFEPLYDMTKKLVYWLLFLAILVLIFIVGFYKKNWKDYTKNQEEKQKINQAYEDKINLANEKSNLYLSLVGSIIVVIDKDETVSMINEAGCKLLGYPKEEIVGKNWFDTFLVQNEIMFVKEISSKILSGHMENVEYFENQVVTKSGEQKDISWHNSLLKNSEGEIVGTVSSGEDITARKKAENDLKQLNEELEEKINVRTKELQTSNKELEAFAYSVSHDLRAPLRSIDGFSKMLMDEFGKVLDDEGLRFLSVIRKNTHTMDRLINDLLTMAKVTRTSLRQELINMEEMVRSIYEENINRDDQQNIIFELDHVPPGFGDPILIQQVWINLITNAIKYTSKKSERTIIVKGTKEEGRVVYSISDNGIGFNPTYKNKLFLPFHRLVNSNEFEGTGIGLAIVERIIHRHSGQVWAEGIEGVGATFYFSLPLQKKG